MVKFLQALAGRLLLPLTGSLILVGALRGTQMITLIENVEITGDIYISSPGKELSPIYCYKSKTGSISFWNCNLNGVEKNEYFAICINESSIKDVHIRMSSIGEVLICNSSATRAIYIDNATIKSLAFSGNSTGNDIFVDGSKIGFLSFYDHVTVGKLSMSQKCDTGNWIISNSSHLNGIDIRNECSTGKIFIIESEVVEFIAVESSCLLFLQSATVPLLKITHCKVHSFKISLACKLEAYFIASEIVLLDFRQVTLGRDALLSFSNSAFYAILMEEYVVIGNLYFRQLKTLTNFENYVRVSELKQENGEEEFLNYFKNWDQEREFKGVINEVKEKEKIERPTIRISQSSLGRTEFSGCPLADFQFEYNNSKITECLIMGCSVPENNIEIYNNTDNNAEIYLQKALFFNQLQKIFLAQGDIYQTTRFKSRWAKEQQKYLSITRKQLNKDQHLSQRITLYSTNISQDMFTFWLNQISNNHGESWVKALVMVVCSSLIFYLLYLLSIKLSSHPQHFDANLVGYYFEFLNPTHKTNFLDEKQKPNGLSVFVDFVGRLFNTYFIYQFIAAFRKHGK